ncbi:outer envelope membrane protein 7-like [Primulina tabacum]|uniref:outer envelope membrane protein 7-like n=1 Tax=Primulina tabacum TaxID=48773 RepID=UPI003F5A4BE5
MGAVTVALIAIAAVALGWLTIEIACKPCLESGRNAIDRNLNPDYDPDDETLDAPLNPNNNESDDSAAAPASSTIPKEV